MTALFNHQKTFLIANPNKSALVWSCGTGKSRTACEWAKTKEHTGTLIICPKSLKTNWIRESGKWGLSQMIIVTKEEFRRDYLIIPSVGQIIVDEIHHGFLTPNFKSQMSKALKNYIKKHSVPRVLLLSATVYTSSPWNIYSLAHYLGYEWSWVKFNYAFFNQVKMGNRMIPMIKKGSEERLANIVKKIASVVDIRDVMDVPEQLHCDPEYFSLTPAQVKGIKANYDPLPIVRYTSEHEIENGIWLGNEFAPSETYPCDKNERILSLCEENKKIAIVCRYNAQIDQLAKLLAKHKPLIIRGDVKDRDSVCLAAEKNDRAVILIQSDCSMGYQLPSFELCVFASMSYSYTNKVQMEGRFLRADKPTRTTFIYLLTEGDSIDQAIYDCMLKKEDFSIALYNKSR